MTSEISVSLDFATREKIDHYVERGDFDDAQELIETAIRRFLYELGLEDTRWPRRTDISQAEMEGEMDDLRRVHRSRPGDDPGIE